MAFLTATALLIGWGVIIIVGAIATIVAVGALLEVVQYLFGRR